MPNLQRDLRFSLSKETELNRYVVAVTGTNEKEREETMEENYRKKINIENSIDWHSLCKMVDIFKQTEYFNTVHPTSVYIYLYEDWFSYFFFNGECSREDFKKVIRELDERIYKDEDTSWSAPEFCDHIDNYEWDLRDLIEIRL